MKAAVVPFLPKKDILSAQVTRYLSDLVASFLLGNATAWEPSFLR